MAVDLTQVFLPYTDEIFKAESKKALLTNDNFVWTGAHTVCLYSVNTSQMNDYKRNPEKGFTGSRYGEIAGLETTLQELTLTKDRSFTFAIDKLDEDETMQQLEAASALARQQREVVIPEIDTYIYEVMTQNAGIKPKVNVPLMPDNIYEEITKASAALDEAEVPEVGRVLIVTPDVYFMMKNSPEIMMDVAVSEEKRRLGVISVLDGCEVVKVPTNRLPEDFGFMMVHPSATVAPMKLEEYKIHRDPPGISGSLVEGRICYDAFVLEKKKNGIYYRLLARTESAVSESKTTYY
ncbi:MAG: hypothetical protein Q4B90_03990 [Eubacteriales bacterium]|nr:hypothetical protein [Eubacteriales bacterium]